MTINQMLVALLMALPVTGIRLEPAFVRSNSSFDQLCFVNSLTRLGTSIIILKKDGKSFFSLFKQSFEQQEEELIQSPNF